MSSKNEKAQAKGGMGGGLVPGTYPPPRALRPTLVGEKWSVVAGHPKVSSVAAEIFSAGGNAIDAGVAAGIASNVIQVDMANFGGIAPILIRPANSKVAYSVAGVGRWSQSVSLKEMIERYNGSLPLDGAPAIVPGAPAAWISALERFGTMSLKQVMEPAIELARNGFLIDQSLATSLEITGRNFQKWPTSAAIYRPEGRALVAGERLRQTALADLFERLVAAESKSVGSRSEKLKAAHRAFYEGEVAETITKTVVSRGGFMTLKDLANFEAEIEVAPSLMVKDWRFFATASWSQGPTALAILGILSRSKFTWHNLAEAITLAFNDREDFLAEPLLMKKPLEELLSDKHLDSLANLIGDDAIAGRVSSSTVDSSLGSTTAVVTMDSAGNTFSTSPSDTLDGGPIISELGIICSPRGVQSRLTDNHPNKLVPGGRPVVTPVALIGLNDEQSWALACPGGDVIVQAMAQVIWRVLNDGMELQEAVEAPRIAAFNAPSAFHPHPSADRLVFAEERIGQDEIAELTKRGHQVKIWPEYEFDAGSVQTIKSLENLSGERVLQAAADPRRSAYAWAK